MALGRGKEALDLIQPSDTAALHAEALLSVGRVDEARQALASPASPQESILAAWLRWRAEGDTGCPQALVDAASAVEQLDEDAEIAAEAGGLAIVCRDEARARQWHLQARAFERKDLTSRRATAETRRLAGDGEGAARLLSRAVALYPESGEARRDLGVAWLQAGQPARAVASLQAALALAPYSQDLSKAAIILAEGTLSAAQRAEQIDEAWVQLSRALDAHGDPANANAASERALLARSYTKVTPAAIATEWLALSARWGAVRQHTKAIEAAQTATRLAPDAVESWLGLAQAQLRAGRVADALGSARKAWDMRPGSPEVAVVLGRAAIAGGDPTEGRRACESALRELAGKPHPLAAELQSILREGGG